MVRIGFIREDNPEDKNAWSGVIHSLYKTISKDYDTFWIEAKEGPYSNFVSRGINKFVSQVLKRNISRVHTKIVSKSVGRNIKRKLAGLKNIDILFAPAGLHNVAYLETDIPIILLSDTTFKAINNYYSFFSNLLEFNIKEADEIERLALIRARHIIYASDWAMNSAINDYGIPKEKISVIEFGANITVPEKIEKVHDKKRLKLLFIGKEWDRKGGEIAIKINYLLKQKYKINSLLRIVGCTPKINLDDSVEIVGFLKDYSNLAGIFSDSDLLILPTKAECAGVVFCDASGYGLPVITYDTGGISNYVMDGINGYRLPINADAGRFASVIADLYLEYKIKPLSISARKIYEDKLNWTIWGRKFKGIVNSILNKQDYVKPKI
jgi:glycosyltransferase involved in cell wall biosynthesis